MHALTEALLGQGIAVRGVVKVLQLLVGWGAALIPDDVVKWFLGRDLVVADVVFAEALIRVNRIIWGKSNKHSSSELMISGLRANWTKVEKIGVDRMSIRPDNP